MKKIIILSITFLLCGCSSYQEITEQDVKDTILGMFDSFSVESSDKNNFYNYVTIEDDWELSDMKISIDKESAHAYFNNKGRFVTLNEGKKTLLNFEWLESAYMVRVDGKLKIKFYFSDTVNQSSEAID
jgi:outer membrane biogenesis lipoprotein LolB